MHYLLLLNLIFLILGGISAITKSNSLKISISCIGSSVLSLIGIVLTFLVAFFPSQAFFYKTAINGVTLSFAVDGLSGFFLIILFGLSALAGIYGSGYISRSKVFIASSPFFPLLIGAMGLVLISRDVFSFLFSWELMSVVSFFLVASEHESPKARESAWIYLIATHIASAFIFAYFAVMYTKCGSLMFADYPAVSGPLASLMFVCILIGFGTKAGIWPFHVWLPYAHPAAPSYVSALMSGIMIKLGIYGILRFTLLLGKPEVWWGILLLSLGMISALLGVLYALSQSNLKKLLAYSSVENIGIVLVGLGVGIIGRGIDNSTLAFLGFGGALFHVLSHSIFKGLLFLNAGSVAHITQTLDIDSLGGLIKKAPVTGTTFLIASMSACGLPPFCGFIGEFLIYIGLFTSLKYLHGPSLIAILFGLVGVAFAGALAIVCFTKAFGIIFLGETRGAGSEHWHESTASICAPLVLLSILALLVAIFPLVIIDFIAPAITTLDPMALMTEIPWLRTTLSLISYIFMALIAALLLAISFYILAFRKKVVERTVTWDCGYEAPTARMQYSGSAFVEPITNFFRSLIGYELQIKNDNCLERSQDISEYSFFRPGFSYFERFVSYVRHYQRRTIQSYLTLIFIALITLLVWEVWIGF